MNTGAAPWMSGWWGLLQFSTSHLPRRLHFLARCSVSLGQQKQSFFSLAKWAWWFTPRALKASQFSIWLLCEQIRLGFSRWECSKHRYWGQQVIRSSLCLTLFSSDTIQSRRWFGWPMVSRVLANWRRFSANTCVQPDVKIFQLWNLGTHLHLSLSPTTLDFIGKLLDGASNIVSGFQVAPVPQTFKCLDCNVESVV